MEYDTDEYATITVNVDNKADQEREVTSKEILEDIFADDELSRIAQMGGANAVHACLLKIGTFEPQGPEFEAVTDEVMEGLRAANFFNG